MGDTPVGPGPPPEGTGPPPAPDPDEGLSPVWEKRYEHGAKVTLPAAEKIREFTLKLVIPNTNNNKNKSTSPSTNQKTVNAHSVHKDFFHKFFDVAECDLHFLATVESNDPNHTLPAPILAKQSFPNTDQLHLAFFHRQIATDTSNKITIVRIKHQVLMKNTIADIKTKMKPWLIQNKAVMSGGDLISTDTCIIAWLPELHYKMVWRPDIEDHFNSRTKNHPRIQAIKAEFFPDDTDIDIPPLFCNKRLIKCGGVASEALAISCVINRATMMKEIISSEDFPSDLAIMPYGFTQVCGPEDEIKWLKLNNDFHNKVQGISIDGFSEEFLDSSVHLDNDTFPTTRELILRNAAIVSIERTKSTDTLGRYLLIVYRNLFQSAQEHIAMICKDIFPNVYSNPQSVAEYKSKYLQLPRVTSAARAGGSVATRSKKMQTLLHSRLQNNAPSTNTQSYAAITRTKVVFDLQSDFPSLNAPNTTNPDNPPNESATITSNGSSTLDPGIPKNTSSSIVSQDVSTIVGSITSEIKSMFTEQSTENRRFQQELFDKQAAKDEQNRIYQQTFLNRQAAKDEQDRIHQQKLLAQQETKDEQIRIFNQQLMNQVTTSQQALFSFLAQIFPTNSGTQPFPPIIQQYNSPTQDQTMTQPDHQPTTPTREHTPAPTPIADIQQDAQQNTPQPTPAKEPTQQTEPATPHETPPNFTYHSIPISTPKSDRPSTRNSQGRGRGGGITPNPKLSQTLLHTYKRPPPPKPISAAAFPDSKTPTKQPPNHTPPDESDAKRSRPAGTTPTKPPNPSPNQHTDDDTVQQMNYEITSEAPSTPPPQQPDTPDASMNQAQDPGTPTSSNTTHSA
jgi:hypothetical protein